MQKAFDKVAETYDSTFTETATGKAQRNIVKRYILRHITRGTVLELNCGTGEDAFFLSKKGFHVMAMDASMEMIFQCLRKQYEWKYSNPPQFLQASFEEAVHKEDRNKYDLIFSNFSGLNCVSPAQLQELSSDFSYALKSGGRMILVFFGTRCIWEWFYFLLKKDPARAFRRSKKNIRASVGGEMMDIYYYSASQLKLIFGKEFKLIRKRPVGLLIPPAYLNSFFTDKIFLLKMLISAEKLFGWMPFLSPFADHFIIEFRKK